jgi:sugar phosphate isomerase/epimerase
VELIAYNYSFKDDFTDAEIDRGFEMTKALGLELITSSATLAAARRVVPFAEMHKMTVAYHGHDETWKPNEFSTPESFATAMAMSKRFKINLDIGHFFAGGFDPVPFIEANHENILVLHIKDRRRNQGTTGVNITGQVPNCTASSTGPCKGANVPWGQGATPIKEVLQLLRDKKYRIPALIEYEYMGTADSLTEVKKCFQYAKDALA